MICIDTPTTATEQSICIEMEKLKRRPSHQFWPCRRQLVPWLHWPCFSASPSRIAWLFLSVTLSYLSMV